MITGPSLDGGAEIGMLFRPEPGRTPARVHPHKPPSTANRQRTLEVIQPGTDAPAFGLDSHKGDKVSSSDFAGKKNYMLVFYPLDFTPT